MRALGDAPRQPAGEARLRDAVAAEELRLGQRPADVLEHLHRVVGGEAAVDHAVRLGPLRRAAQRAVVGRPAARAAVERDGHAESLRGRAGVGRDPAAVDLAVVQDREVLAPAIARRGHQRRGLDVVVGQQAEVGAVADRVVLARLALLGARPGARHPVVGVARADHRDAGLVEDRQRDLARARVELADVGDRAVVLGRPDRVARRALRRPSAGLLGRAVECHQPDRPPARLAAGLLQRLAGALVDRLRRDARGAAERQARVDRQLLGVGRGREGREDQESQSAPFHGANAYPSDS